MRVIVELSHSGLIGFSQRTQRNNLVPVRLSKDRIPIRILLSYNSNSTPKQMQSTTTGGSGGLARFRSAPAAWLEALLEDEEEDPLKPNNHCLTHLLTGDSPPDQPLFQSNPSPATFLRQNSSPPDFGIGDGFYSSYAPLTSSPTLKREESGVSSLIDMEMEKLLEDSVPCRVRAKRGCATHPRSIAERVRRTKISDRIRKLQEVVPNMDKQTNTADMLEEAVEYVKFLQKQIQELTEHQRRCKCMVKE